MPIGWQQWSVAGGTTAAQRSVWTPPVPRQLCSVFDGMTCTRNRWLDLDWLIVICGWLVTAFAVMLGAPFWFDVLNKFMVIRSTVKPHEKSPEEASEDRQR